MGFLSRFFQKISKMASGSRTKSICYVRNVTGEPRIRFTFEIPNNEGKKKMFNSVRHQDEPLSKSLERIATNVSKHVSKRKKGKDKSGDDNTTVNVDVQVLQNGKTLAAETPVAEAFIQGSILKIMEECYEIEVNTPTVNNIKLPTSLMAGFPIFPLIETEFIDETDSDFTWTKLKYKIDEEETAVEEKKKKKTQARHRNITESVEVARTLSYCPSNSDIDYFLKFECSPKNGKRTGKAVEAVSKYPVMAGPGLCPFEKRQVFTQSVTEPGVFRVVSYNILADLYADSDYSRTELFPYCPPYALELDYRKHLLIKELQGYNSDIICLQEVDRKFYKRDLSTALENLHFSGSFFEKGIDVKIGEGSAIFFRKSKFKQVGDHSMLLKKILEEEDVCEDILEKVYANEKLKQKLETRSSILHVLGLESVEISGKLILLVNTHLYFHPNAGNIRLIHCVAALRYLEKLLKQYQAEGYSASLVFCGDFNSVPERAIYKYFTTKTVTKDCEDWMTAGEEMFVDDMNYSHSLSLGSACGIVPYTNYTEAFNAMLDYIYYDLETLEVNRVVPPLDHEDVIQHIALPNVVFPSDHIAQICDLEWKF